jgi:hypothetical protein
VVRVMILFRSIVGVGRNLPLSIDDGVL